MVCKMAKTDDEMAHQANSSSDLLFDNTLTDSHCLHISDNSFELGKDSQIFFGRRTVGDRKVSRYFQHDSRCVNGK